MIIFHNNSSRMANIEVPSSILHLPSIALSSQPSAIIHLTSYIEVPSYLRHLTSEYIIPQTSDIESLLTSVVFLAFRRPI